VVANSSDVHCPRRFGDARSREMQLTRHDPSWLLEQAWRQVRRATTAEDRARALSTYRRSISTARKHGASPELLERIGQLEGAAQDLYGEVQDDHVRRALRALGSLRMAIEARLSSDAGAERIRVQPVDYDGRESGPGWEADQDLVMRHYGIPPEYRDAKIVVQLHLGGGPDVRAYRGRKIVWRKPSTPHKEPRPRRAMADEEGEPNGRTPGRGIV
jgi:hypothetical protein